MTKPFLANDSVVIEVVNAAVHKRLPAKSERHQSELAEPALPTMPPVVSLVPPSSAYVAQLLKLTRGNVSEAARRSGLDRSDRSSRTESRPRAPGKGL